MKKLLLIVISTIILMMLVSCGTNEGDKENKTKTEDTSTYQESKGEVKTVEEKEDVVDNGKIDMQSEAEANAKKHPAKPGAVLVTKGDYKFTGMKYYFKGEIVKLTTIENNVGDPSTWLVKNDNGYVMPIQHDRFEAKEGDIVEVWGTLSGDGFDNAEGIDNVVGQTGSMHAMIVTVNGERQY